MLACHGRVQREGDVIHVVTERLDDLSELLKSLGGRQAPFPLRHGRGDEVTHQNGPDPREAGAHATGTEGKTRTADRQREGNTEYGQEISDDGEHYVTTGHRRGHRGLLSAPADAPLINNFTVSKLRASSPPPGTVVGLEQVEEGGLDRSAASLALVRLIPKGLTVARHIC